MERYYFEYPPFEGAINILTEEEYWEELPPNYHYERVTVGDGEDYDSVEAMEAYVARQNADFQHERT